MTVGELRKIIEDMDDDILVLTSGNDYSYREVDAWPSEATYWEEEHYYGEYWGKDELLEGQEVINALVIR